MNLIYYSLFIFSSFVLFSCTSGKRSLEKGDYYSAVIQSVEKLRKRPTHKKSRETLKRSYPLAVDALEKESKEVIAADMEFKYKKAFLSYEKINKMYEEIRTSPAASGVISDPVNYFVKMTEIREKAAEESYEAGVNALLQGTRKGAMEAYYLFNDAKGFDQSYKDVEDKLEESKSKATLNVIIEEIPVPADQGISSAFFQQSVEGIFNDKSGAFFFVEIDKSQEVEPKDTQQADHLIKLQFDSFRMTSLDRRSNTYSVSSKDSVKIETIELADGTKKDIYDIVHARVTIFEKSLDSYVFLTLEIVDASTNAILKTQKFKNSYEWKSEWARYSGDHRALTAEQTALARQSEKRTPTPQQLFSDTSNRIYKQLRYHLSSFYATDFPG